jgi:hypothetical protein
MLEATGRAIQKLFFLVDDAQTLFADSVSAIEIARTFLLSVVEVVTHGTLHWDLL